MRGCGRYGPVVAHGLERHGDDATAEGDRQRHRTPISLRLRTRGEVGDGPEAEESSQQPHAGLAGSWQPVRIDETGRGENESRDEWINHNADHSGGDTQPDRKHTIMPPAPSRISPWSAQGEGDLKNRHSSKQDDSDAGWQVHKRTLGRAGPS